MVANKERRILVETDPDWDLSVASQFGSIRIRQLEATLESLEHLHDKIPDPLPADFAQTYPIATTFKGWEYVESQANAFLEDVDDYVREFRERLEEIETVDKPRVVELERRLNALKQRRAARTDAPAHGPTLAEIDDEIAAFEQDIVDKKDWNEEGAMMMKAHITGCRRINELYIDIMAKITEERAWFVTHVPASAALLNE